MSSDSEPSPPPPLPSHKRWGLEEWRLLFAGFQAAAGVTLASLAIYGVFFTSIPEIIIRQLRADVADAREELAGLRGERNRLATSLETLNTDLRAAGAKSKETAEMLAQREATLGVTSKELAVARQQLATDNENVAKLEAQSKALQAANDAASSKLKQLEADMARLSVERATYLRSTEAAAFSLATFSLMSVVVDGQLAVKAARDVLDAPRWNAEDESFRKRIAGFGAAERVQKTNEENARRHKELSEDEDSRWVMLGLGMMSYDLVKRARAKFDEYAKKMPASTGRVLILERIRNPGNMTPADFAAYRKRIEVAVQRNAQLDQLLLPRIAIVEQGGEAGRQEVERASKAVEAFKEAIFDLSRRLDPTQR